MKLRLASLSCVLALVALACGQKPGVHARGVGNIAPGTSLTGTGTGVPAPSASPSFDPATGTFVDPTTGQVVDPTTGQPTTPTGVPGAAGAPNNAGGGGGGGGTTLGGADRSGVTATNIRIAIHAPVTGAAPVRSDSFNTGKDLYWLKGSPSGGPVKVFGRGVEVLFANDNYNPSTATQKCKQMAESGQKAFLLIGGAGTDQIYACARYARDNGIPYLSAGVVQNSLQISKGFRNYFALSMSYAQQGKLLADFIRKNASKFGCPSSGCRVGAVVTDTANFDDALEGFKKAWGSLAGEIRPSKSDSGTEYGSQLCTGPQKNYDVVFPLTSPTFWLEMSGTAACYPQYVGVGVSMGLDTVASVGCKSSPEAMAGSVFFSPSPSFKGVGDTDAAFKKAGGGDDIEYLLWGLMKTVHQMLLKTGKDLTRQKFIQTVEKSSFSTGNFPPVSYKASNHFGASKVHVLEAVCEGSSGYYRTLKKFAPPF